MTCSREGCEAEARWEVYILIRPPEPMEGVIRAFTSLIVCEVHRADLTPEMLVTDEGWEALVKALAAIDRLEPSRERTGIDFEAIQ